jgi:lipoate-protein ligase A
VARRGTSDLAVFTDCDTSERKVSGNALRVRRHGVLYHGTLLDRFDLGLVGTVLRHPPREPDYRSRRPHGEFLANLGLGREALEQIVRAAFHATLTQGEWPRDRVARLVAERYGTSEWTGRL